MKVLVLCYEYPPLGGGGGRVAQTVARALVRRGHEVRVQTAALGWRSCEEDDQGVRVFRTASGRAKADTCRVHEMGTYCLTSFFPTLLHLGRWRPDVVHAHFAVPTGFLAWAAHAFISVPYVLTAHLGDVPGGVPEQTDKLFRVVNPLAKRVWSAAAACTAVSTFVQSLATQAYDRPVERILNGIDLSTAIAPRDLEPGPRRFVFVGRFSVQKNPVALIDGLAGLSTRDWNLTMVGDGPLRGAVEHRVEQLGLGKHVAIAGWLAASAVQEVLRNSDVLVMPSLSEGLPVAAIEGLRHGLAIVASDVPGLHDVVEDGRNGFRVPLHDPPALTRALNAVLDPEPLAAMRDASWRKVQAFELEGIVDQYEAVLRRAAKTP